MNPFPTGRIIPVGQPCKLRRPQMSKLIDSLDKLKQAALGNAVPPEAESLRYKPTIGEDSPAPAASIVDKPASVESTLHIRGSRYGTLAGNGAVSQAIKVAMRSGGQWPTMSSDQQEALDQFACKIARICTGDPDYVDNWLDVEGYARLVRNKLEHGHELGESLNE